MQISIRPIPLWGSKTISKSAISRLFVREKTTECSSNEWGPSQVRKSHELSWVDSQDNRRPLVKGLLSNEALYLEARLEKILGIKNQIVDGAYLG
ncbi:MAG: hypothetical protein NTW21_28915 [Verrucomicrobia bacterium]|nr:hypothetical protein [Verrucomicrobiota bacterium]